MRQRWRQSCAPQVPYLLGLGDKEEESATAALRRRGEGDLGAKPLDEIIRMLQEEIASKAY